MPAAINSDWRLRRYWAIAVAAQSLVAVLGTAFSHSLGFSPKISAFSDLGSYFSQSMPITRGMIPYRDIALEYPPLALPFFMAPLLVGGDLRSYKLAFIVEMILVNACLTWLVGREVGRSERADRVPSRIAWYSIYFMILCPMNITRYDLVPTLAAFW